VNGKNHYGIPSNKSRFAWIICNYIYSLKYIGLSGQQLALSNYMGSSVLPFQELNTAVVAMKDFLAQSVPMHRFF